MSGGFDDGIGGGGVGGGERPGFGDGGAVGGGALGNRGTFGSGTFGSDNALGSGAAFGNSAGGDRADSLSPLRAGLRAEADLVTISPPPIAAVRQSAGRRRAWRLTFQGFAGVAVACALVGGILVWAPVHGTADGPVPPGSSTTPAATSTAPVRTATNPAPTPGRSAASSSSSAGPVTAAAWLTGGDIGAGWTGSTDNLAPRPALTVVGSTCQNAGVYQPQIPLSPAPNKLYQGHSASGQQTGTLLEAVYTFAPGTGHTVMEKVRAAVATGCGDAKAIKLLPAPQTVADEAIVYSDAADVCNILVRSGDRVASAIVDPVPAGQAGTDLLDHLARQMAARLTAD